MQKLAEQEDAVLFIDEIHTLIGAGAASGGTMDASNLLKPALSNGSLKCIGATTYQEYRGIFEKDHALSRRFQKVDVEEPSVAETVEILKGLKSRFEKHHSVKYSAAALNTAAELSAKYINDRHLPDKAIDVIDEAGAAQRILPKSKQKKVIGDKEIEDIIAKIARIPPKNISTDDRNALKTLDRDLKAVVFGQDQAIESLASAIKMARSGLGNANKPIGSFLFSGPTGVGKTELAKKVYPQFFKKKIVFNNNPGKKITFADIPPPAQASDPGVVAAPPKIETIVPNTVSGGAVDASGKRISFS